MDNLLNLPISDRPTAYAEEFGIIDYSVKGDTMTYYKNALVAPRTYRTYKHTINLLNMAHESHELKRLNRRGFINN